MCPLHDPPPQVFVAGLSQASGDWITLLILTGLYVACFPLLLRFVVPVGQRLRMTFFIAAAMLCELAFGVGTLLIASPAVKAAEVWSTNEYNKAWDLGLSYPYLCSSRIDAATNQMQTQISTIRWSAIVLQFAGFALSWLGVWMIYRYRRASARVPTA